VAPQVTLTQHSLFEALTSRLGVSKERAAELIWDITEVNTGRERRDIIATMLYQWYLDPQNRLMFKKKPYVGPPPEVFKP